MAKDNLEFDKPVAELDKSYAALAEHALQTTGGEVPQELAALSESIDGLKRYFQAHLGPWEKVLIARHPKRPQPVDFISMLFTDFFELHGDRRFGDDPAIVGGFACLDGEPVMVIATRKGRELSEFLTTHFGCAEPEGYRKAHRLMELAQKADRPVITLVDTPGAYPGISGGERHIGEAIACNLRDMFRLKVPVISVVTGEGGSGGALGLAVGNRVLMLENAYYSAITPEGCAAILWRSPDKVQDAASALKLTAEDLLSMGIVDEIVPEPLGGAHHDPVGAAAMLKDALKRHLDYLKKRSHSRLKDMRYRRFRALGKFVEE